MTMGLVERIVRQFSTPFLLSYGGAGGASPLVVAIVAGLSAAIASAAIAHRRFMGLRLEIRQHGFLLSTAPRDRSMAPAGRPSGRLGSHIVLASFTYSPCDAEPVDERAAGIYEGRNC
jgi:hypothetical protein